MYEYKVYDFKRREWIEEILRAAFQIIFTGMLFFRSWIACLLLAPAIIWLLKKRKDQKRRKRISELRLDFREVILSLAASLHAGYSLEQCISIALEDLRRLYPDEERPMIEELIWMIRNMEMNIPIEQLFHELAARSGLEEIRSFSAVVSTVKKQGGNLVKISQRTAEHISKKIQIQMEIDQVIAGKKFEKKIMFFMPYFILIYLQLTNKNYLAPLFHNIYGNTCMLICLLAIYAAEWWADQVVHITI